jgi:hypothetical protein
MSHACLVPEKAPPHMTVEIGYRDNHYTDACLTYGGGHQLLDKWQALGDLLAHRAGWHFDIVRGEAVWSLGAFGESRLNIRVLPAGTYRCFDDESRLAATMIIDQIEEWLQEREEAARRIAPSLRDLIADSDWQRLRTYTYEVRVSWSDGWYCAVVRGLPQEACFERTLDEVLRGARTMLIDSAGAPHELADELSVRVKLDVAATKQFIDG